MKYRVNVYKFKYTLILNINYYNINEIMPIYEIGIIINKIINL